MFDKQGHFCTTVEHIQQAIKLSLKVKLIKLSNYFLNVEMQNA